MIYSNTKGVKEASEPSENEFYPQIQQWKNLNN